MPRRWLILRWTVLGCVFVTWAFSGNYSLTLRAGNVGLVTLTRGTLSGLLYTEKGTGTFGDLGDTWWVGDWFSTRPDDERPIPLHGLMYSPNFRLDWRLPGFHREYSSPIGEWWFVHLPLWLVSAVLLLSISNNGNRAGWFAVPQWRRLRSIAILLAAALAVIGLASSRIYATSAWGKFNVDLVRAEITILYEIEDIPMVRASNPPAFDAYIDPEPVLQFRPPHTAACGQSTIGRWREVVIPLWTIAMLFAMVALAAHRQCLRIPTGCCKRCGYDLRGTPGDRCSECGAVAASK